MALNAQPTNPQNPLPQPPLAQPYRAPASEAERSGHAVPGWVAPTAIAGLGVVAVLGLVFLGGQHQFEPTKPATAVAHTSVATPSRATGPGFDTVRVDPGGNAVIAGHAAPGSIVTITANGKPIGTTKADATGSFAFVTSTPLAAGGQQLALSAAGKNGEILASNRSVTVAVPEAPNEGALAVLGGTSTAPSRVLTGQGPKPGSLGLGSVDYDGTGKAVIAGTAKPGAVVSLFLGTTKLGTATADKAGRWTMRTDTMPTKPGTFTLETISPTGAVLHSMQTAFAPHKVGPLAPGQIVITQGQCLWQIARKLYGKGTDFALIYRANEAAIHDPDLIYPGQHLALPKTATPTPG